MWLKGGRIDFIHKKIRMIVISLSHSLFLPLVLSFSLFNVLLNTDVSTSYMKLLSYIWQPRPSFLSSTL